MLFNFFSKNPKDCKLTPSVLLVLDGWGIAPPSQGNAIYLAKKPFVDWISQNFPSAQLIASGESVGLPANEEGNSEVGHLAIGVGRVVLQSLKKIDLAIESGSFFDNPAFMGAVHHVKSNSSKLHIMGLVSSGKVHAALNHLYALLEFCKLQGLSNTKLHLFTDGRDAPPNEAESIIAQIESKLAQLKVAQIATISGRYFAMDRDARWDRTQKVYDVIVQAKGQTSSTATEAIKNAYASAQTDEFIVPTVIQSAGDSKLSNNDAVIFFNFRVDRPRQLTMSFVMPNFENLPKLEVEASLGSVATHKPQILSGPTFHREVVPQNIYFATMTRYQKAIPVTAVAYETETVHQSLPEVVSDAGLNQFHLAESEKERMVTYYMDGMRSKTFPNEDVKIVPSAKVPTYDKKPEMSVYQIVSEYKKALHRCHYHLFVMNFANPDMVAHSGNIQATIKAIEHVDSALKNLVGESLKYNATVFITADHGNAEELLTYPTKSFFFTTHEGDVNTDHSSNPVPLYIIGNQIKGKKDLGKGTLADVAPTILTHMRLPVPSVMTGRNLLD